MERLNGPFINGARLADILHPPRPCYLSTCDTLTPWPKYMCPRHEASFVEYLMAEAQGCYE